jgi:hypothetical protein
MTSRLAEAQHLVYTAITELLIDLPDNVHELDRSLVENRGMIDRLSAARPDLYEKMKARAESRRAALRKAGHLTPASGSRVNQPPLSADPFEAYHQLMDATKGTP